MMRNFFFLLLLLPNYSYAETTIAAPGLIETHKPIVVKAITDGSACFWRVNKPAEYIAVDNNKTLYIWAPPGRYEIELTAVLVDWDSKLVTAEQAQATIEVSGNPTPTPTPIPIDGKRHMTIIRESADMTAQLATLLLKLRTSELSQKLTILDPQGKNEQNQPIPGINNLLEKYSDLPAFFVVASETGQVLYGGQLPSTYEQIVELYKKYGGE